jgi:carboxypeptidase Q
MLAAFMRSHLPSLLFVIGAGACTSGGATPAARMAAGAAAAVESAPSGSARPADIEVLDRASKIREATLRTSVALDTVRSLVDEASPRLSGSAGFTAAVGWAERAMTAAGLSGVHTERALVPHWERGDERGEIVAPYPHRVAIAALGGSVGTAAAGLEAEVIEVESLETLAKVAPGAARGKIVFFHTVMQRTKDGAGYGKAVVVRLSGAIEAAKLGAVGVIIRSMGTDENRTPHTGGMRYDPVVPAIPAAALSIPDADLLHRILAQHQPVRFRMSLGARSLPDSEGFNVVGDVAGSGAPDEIVLLGAHLDSWDLGQGALDDGAGCAIVLEAARQIARAGEHPRRTVRVVFFANEENGLAGAKAYAKAHEGELGKHVLALEADFGTGRAYETRFLGGGGEPHARYLLVAASVKPLGIEVSDGEAEGGADLTPLQALGVPIMDLRQDGSLYFDFHHTANDTVEHLVKANLDQVAAAFAAAAYTAAALPGDFGRVAIEKREHHR